MKGIRYLCQQNHHRMERRLLVGYAQQAVYQIQSAAIWNVMVSGIRRKDRMSESYQSCLFIAKMKKNTLYQVENGWSMRPAGLFKFGTDRRYKIRYE